MIQIKRFTFNPFQVNTYVLFDETGECVIVDPGMDNDNEKNKLVDFIAKNNLKPVMLLNTHAHIDHILSNDFIAHKYNLKLYAHIDSDSFLAEAKAHAQVFGMQIDDVKKIDENLVEGQIIEFGNSKLKVFETPGHANGSVCFYTEEGKFVVTGDVLFLESIGRTDLKTGDYDVLQKSIWEKLFTLPEETTAYPGHGPETKIGHEKLHNPFVAIGKDLD